MQRRNFIKVAAAAGIAGIGVYELKSLFGYRYRSQRAEGPMLLRPGLTGKNGSGVLKCLPLSDLTAGFEISLPLHNPHALALHPQDPKIVYVFDIFGPLACMVSLETRSVLRTVKAPSGRNFSGHGSFANSPDILYTTENTHLNDPGYVVARNSQSMEEIALIPSGGNGAHDIRYFSKENQLVVANSGGKTRAKGEPDETESNLAFVDVNSKKIMHRVSSPGYRLRHFDFTVAGEIGIGAQAYYWGPGFRLGTLREMKTGQDFTEVIRYEMRNTEFFPAPLLFFHSATGELRKVEPPAPEAGRLMNTNSVAGEPGGNLCATHNRGSSLSLWNAKEAKLLAFRELGSAPGGVIYSSALKAFLVDMDEELLAFSGQDFQPVRLCKNHGVFASHMEIASG